MALNRLRSSTPAVGLGLSLGLGVGVGVGLCCSPTEARIVAGGDSIDTQGYVCVYGVGGGARARVCMFV